jgi:ribosomal protein L11 methylase PrmA
MNYYEAIKMDKIYSKIPLEKIPWNFQTPPATLVDLVNSRKVKPCKTVDMGCGTGNYAIYLGSLGFDVTGFDVSKSAVKIAIKNAKKKNIKAEGKYLSVCFSEKDVRFGGSGKYRSTKLDTVLYFSSLTELKELFTPYFDIVEAKIIKIRGKPFSHFANYIFMKKKR